MVCGELIYSWTGSAGSLSLGTLGCLVLLFGQDNGSGIYDVLLKIPNSPGDLQVSLFPGLHWLTSLITCLDYLMSHWGLLGGFLPKIPCTNLLAQTRGSVSPWYTEIRTWEFAPQGCLSNLQCLLRFFFFSSSITLLLNKTSQEDNLWSPENTFQNIQIEEYIHLVTQMGDLKWPSSLCNLDNNS
jgi:hypothetical protein